MRASSTLAVVWVLLAPAAARPAEGGSSPDAEELTRECASGGTGACAALGRLARKLLHGDGVPADPKRAAALLGKACDGGDAPACVGLGSMLMRGEGVKEDLDQARRAFERACGAEDGLACWELGLMYEYGQGVSMSVSSSIRYYEQSCRAKNAYACAKLGAIYDEGSAPGKAADASVRAADWWAMGCELGAPEACVRIGEAYVTGKGREKDEARAAVFFKKACDAGEKQGCAGLERVPRSARPSN